MPDPITCAPDADHFQYDVWGVEDGSREGSEDGDLY